MKKRLINFIAENMHNIGTITINGNYSMIKYDHIFHAVTIPIWYILLRLYQGNSQDHILFAVIHFAAKSFRGAKRE